jgi:GWxTD domain-containing protein
MRRALLLLSFCAMAGAHAAIDVVVETKVYQNPGALPRVAVNLAVPAGSYRTAINSAGFAQGRIEAVAIIELEGTIKAFAKTEVLGPERLDSLQADLVHQEFFDLPPGGYTLTVEARDLNASDTTAARYHAPLLVWSLPSGIALSDLLIAERLEPDAGSPGSRFGYHAVPLLSDYLPQQVKSVSLYAEVYGTTTRFGQDSLFLLTCQIEHYEGGGVANGLRQSTRTRAAAVVPAMATFDITELPSGNYLAVVEARDRKGELLVRRESMLQRNNPIRYKYDMQSLASLDTRHTFADAISDPDTLMEHVNSLRPIADPLERKIIDDRWKDRDIALMKRFLYSFWANRSNAPEQAWNDYRREVDKVNRLFGCRLMKGYQTDRGYVYLRYGPPNAMMDRMNEMDAYPYSIWHYYRAGKYTNRRFVFYQPDLVSSCMVLLHSEVPGETFNPLWNQVLHSRNVAMPNVQPQSVGNQSSDRVDEFYLNPR